MLTYQDDAKHVQTQLSNIIVLLSCQQVDNLTNEKRNENIATHSEDEEYEASDNRAALSVGIPSDLFERLTLLLL